MDLLFRKARTHNVWQEKEVSDVLLEAIYDLANLGSSIAIMTRDLATRRGRVIHRSGGSMRHLVGDPRALGLLLKVVGNPDLAGPLRADAAMAVADLFDRRERLALTPLLRDLDFASRIGVYEKLLALD